MGGDRGTPLEAGRDRVDRELAVRHPGSQIPLAGDPGGIVVRGAAVPRHDERVVAEGRHGRKALVGLGVVVDAELRPERSAGGVEPPREDIALAAGRVVVAAHPCHEEAPARVHGDRHVVLSRGGVRVHEEVAGHRYSGGVEPPGEHAVRVSRRFAAPDDDEITGGVHGDRGIALVAGRVRVHAKRTPLRHAGRVVPLREDAVAAAVLSVALPCDDEGSARVHRHGRRALAPGGVGVHAKLRARRPRGVETARPDVVAAVPEAAVGDDEAAGGIAGHRGVRLRAGREVVDAELAAEREHRRRRTAAHRRPRCRHPADSSATPRRTGRRRPARCGPWPGCPWCRC